MKAKAKGLRLSDPKVLLGISVVLLLIGGMIIDPLAGFLFMALASLLALAAVIRARRWLRYVAVGLLIILVTLTAAKLPQAGRHLELYKSRQGGITAPKTPSGGA